MIFNGDEALQEVAKVDGNLDWALVGPSVEHLSLAGSGADGVEEMADALSRHSRTFGMVRLAFGVGDDATTRFLFVIHDCEDASDAAGVAEMRERLQEFVPRFDAEVHLRSDGDCLVERFIHALLAVVTPQELYPGPEEWEMLTLLNFELAREIRQEQKRGFVQRRETDDSLGSSTSDSPSSLLSSADLLACSTCASISSSSLAPELEMTPSSTQRRSARMFAKGDRVEILGNNKTGEWLPDGEVVDFVKESCIRDKIRVRAGSTKVVYANGTQFRWLAPSVLEDYVRPSPRPKFPQPTTGTFLFETHSRAGTWWKPVYCELQRGFLRWWETLEEAKEGAAPAGAVCMLGLRLAEEASDASCRLRFRADGVPGVVYSLQAGSERDAAALADAFWIHEGYCEAEFELHSVEQEVSVVRADVIRALANQHGKRKAIARDQHLSAVLAEGLVAAEVRARGAAAAKAAAKAAGPRAAAAAARGDMVRPRLSSGPSRLTPPPSSPRRLFCYATRSGIPPPMPITCEIPGVWAM